MKRNSLSSLPVGFLYSYSRNQSNEVKANIRTALRVFSFEESKLNLSKEIISQKEEDLNHRRGVYKNPMLNI